MIKIISLIFEFLSPPVMQNLFGIDDLLTTYNVSDMQWVTILFAMVGKFCVSSSNVVMPVFTAELFPTVMRNLGVGSSNVPAGVALMLVPYLWRLVSTTSAIDDLMNQNLANGGLILNTNFALTF